MNPLVEIKNALSETPSAIEPRAGGSPAAHKPENGRRIGKIKYFTFVHCFTCDKKYRGDLLMIGHAVLKWKQL